MLKIKNLNTSSKAFDKDFKNLLTKEYLGLKKFKIR